MVMDEKRHPILSGNRLVESMRYGGYKNPAYALAEIVDNAFEANADHIEVICKDGISDSGQMRERLDEIAIVDNGKGMSKEELWNSLTLGEGTRRERRGIGRFGVGLPYSSISQCKKVSVYTWRGQDVLMTYLDLNELEKENVQEIPEPKKRDIPSFWKRASKILSDAPEDDGSGTLVIWSNLDKCKWKKSKTMIDNSEKIIGRIYRKFISGDHKFMDGNQKLKITMMSIDDSGKSKMDREIRPNDPLYQMIPSSTPSPYDKKCMFNLDGERPETIIKVKDNAGVEHDVVMRFAYATKEAREEHNGKNAGGLPHGKHANANLGVSVIRAGRELYLDTNLLQTYDPLERWWGAEVEFSPELDEFFGISNNKQDAASFRTATEIIGSRGDEGSGSDVTHVEDDQMESLVKKLNKRVRGMRTIIKRQNKNTRSKPRYQGEGPNNAKNKREETNPTKTGYDREHESEKTREEKLRGTLTDILSGNELDARVKDLIKDKLSVDFVKTDLTGYQFFDVSLEGGVEIIKINTSHNAYKNLLSVVDDFPEDIDREDAVRSLRSAQAGLQLLLGSWACLEDEVESDQKRKEIQHIRYKWGEILNEYLNK